MNESEAVATIVQFIKANYGRTSESAIAAETGLTVEQIRQVFAHKLHAVSAGYFRIATGVRKATAEDAFSDPKLSR